MSVQPLLLRLPFEDAKGAAALTRQRVLAIVRAGAAGRVLERVSVDCRDRSLELRVPVAATFSGGASACGGR